MTGTANVTLASRSITRIVETTPVSDTSQWAADPLTFGAFRALDTTANFLYYMIHVPHGVTLTAVSVYLEGLAGHGGLPATMPAVALITVTPSSGSSAITSGPTSDSSANVAAYEAAHAITLSGLSVSIDRTTKRYIVRVSNESSTNSLHYLTVYGVAVTYTTTAYDED
jgi:hypothetical protein